MKFNKSGRLMALVLTFLLLFPQHIYGEEISANDLYAKSAVLMDGDSGRVLYEKNGYDKLPMASTTKIMTCIIALEEGNMDQICEASSAAAAQPAVHIGVNAGERFRLEDLLYSLMLESHNDAAVMIAEAVAGSVEAFAEKMNQKAWDLGCQDTYFITPNGLDKADENGIHSTTAADLATIMTYCIQNEDFLTITRTGSYTFTDMDGKRTVSCNNHNSFLSMMEGALSGKTGFTGNAGYCYVGALERDGKTFVVALLACGWPNNKSYKWSDTKKLMTYGLENYEYRNVWEEPDFAPVQVSDGIPEEGDLADEAQVHLRLEADVSELPVLLSAEEQVEVIYELPEQLTAPIGEGATVGKVSYILDGKVIKSCGIVVVDDIEKIDFIWCLRKAADMLLAGDQWFMN